MNTRDVVIVDYARSAFGRLGGGLREFAASELAGSVIKGLAEKSGIQKRASVDSVIAGCAHGCSKTQAIARYSALHAGLPFEVSATFVEMQCGSSILALNQAAWKIQSGMAEIVICGGTECHSQHPAFMSTITPPYKEMAPVCYEKGLTPIKERDIDMISVSDKIAAEYQISRTMCDEFALRSQRRLQEAYRDGTIGSEILPLVIPATRKTPEKIISQDEFPRPNTTLEGLSSLRPVHPGGVTTAGNASGLNDGAAFLLVMTDEKARELGYTPVARWVSCAHVGYYEDLMGIAPCYSNLKALKHAGLTLKDADVFECNEAFAAQNLGVISQMEQETGMAIDQAIWNPLGGALAVGHPNGASGARIAIFAMRYLEKSGGKYGVVSACCGGGLGATVIIENLRR
ncbi:thiolase family protein [uncultured Oscillibacter sp.]|uniref:thiolase family protein n=1 Tax=uncultured Oscillibacter sp. TaxID=876091 RepID=UPI00260BA0A9|nr:thiolase family protein [uncultured Oscillibacter sp.]